MSREDILGLPFVVAPAPDDATGAYFAYWSNNLTGGKALADAAVTFMREHELPVILGHVAKAQAAIGKFGPTENDFWTRISERLIFMA